MTDLSKQKLAFVFCTGLGVCLLGAHWFVTGATISFFLMLFVACMSLLRWRVSGFGWTSVIDVILFLFAAPFGLGVAFFAAMYHKMYFMMLAVVYVFFTENLYIGAIAVLGGGTGLLMRLWENEREERLKLRDTEVGRYYKLEELQSRLLSSQSQIERMTAISERARISREIHDNAGHELVAAYMSLQTVRAVLEDTNADADALQLFDAGMERLDSGVKKMRDAVHNMAPITTIGIESLREACAKFPKKVEFKHHGDTNHVPVHVWNILEACLNESLTNATKHANPSAITVEIDATAHIVRLCVENDGVTTTSRNFGTGLRNLRYRLTAAGGNISVVNDHVYRVVCVLPISKLCDIK